MGYYHFAFLSDESVLGAEASECAAEQEKFWEYHDLLFENRESLTNEKLKSLADQLGLDQQTFGECLDTGKYKPIVEQQNAFARQLGVQSTPSFLVNGFPMVGAQPFDAFQKVIEQFLE